MISLPPTCISASASMSPIRGGGSPISRQYNMNFVAVKFALRCPVADRDGRMAQEFPRAQSVLLQEQFLNGGAGFAWESRFGGAEPVGAHRWLIKSLKDQTQTLRTSILAGPTLKLPSQQFKLDPIACRAARHSTSPFMAEP